MDFTNIRSIFGDEISTAIYTMLNYVRSILESPDQKPMDDMLELLRNAPSQGPELWSSIRQQAHYKQGFIEGGTVLLKKTSEEGAFGLGYPVGLFDAKSHDLIAIASKQGNVTKDLKFHEILGVDYPGGLYHNKDAKQENNVKLLFQGADYQQNYMLTTPSGKYYMTRLEHVGQCDIKIPGPIDLTKTNKSDGKDKGKEIDID